MLTCHQCPGDADVVTGPFAEVLCWQRFWQDRCCSGRGPRHKPEPLLEGAADGRSSLSSTTRSVGSPQNAIAPMAFTIRTISAFPSSRMREPLERRDIAASINCGDKQKTQTRRNGLQAGPSHCRSVAIRGDRCGMGRASAHAGAEPFVSKYKPGTIVVRIRERRLI